jgi:hypothetical protein
MLGLHPARLAIADARVVDYGVEATELIDLVCYGRRPGDRSGYEYACHCSASFINPE